jgi:hypothetical protein
MGDVWWRAVSAHRRQGIHVEPTAGSVAQR